MAKYLIEWGLSHLIDSFMENKVTYSVMAMLTDADIDRLIPVMGDRLIFLNQWRCWKEILLCSVNEKQVNQPYILQSEECSYMDISGTDYQSVSIQQKTGESSGCTTNAFADPCKISDIASCAPQCAPTVEDTEVYIILSKTYEGRALIKTYKDKGLLDADGRRTLCRLIVDNELQSDPGREISSSRHHSLSASITEVFKNEYISTYFVPYKNNRETKTICYAKGKLFDAFHNRRSRYRAKGILVSRRLSRSTGSCSPASERSSPAPLEPSVEDVTESLVWLSRCCDNWNEVLDHWERTYEYRVRQLENIDLKITDFITCYKPLSQPAGYTLLVRDFDRRYPGRSSVLHLKFPDLRPKLYAQARHRAQKSKEAVEKDILTKIIACENESEDISNVGAFIAVAYILPTTTVKVKRGKVRPSKKEVLDGFITHVTSESGVLETVTRRRSHMVEKGETLQPFVICVGDELCKMRTYYVVLDDIKYKVSTILDAIDTTFKIIMVLGAEYSRHSSTVWELIQKACYGISTPHDQNYPVVNTLLSDLGLVEIK